jgi:hypothetical protein
MQDTHCVKGLEEHEVETDNMPKRLRDVRPAPDAGQMNTNSMSINRLVDRLRNPLDRIPGPQWPRKISFEVEPAL